MDDNVDGVCSVEVMVVVVGVFAGNGSVFVTVDVIVVLLGTSFTGDRVGATLTVVVVVVVVVVVLELVALVPSLVVALLLLLAFIGVVTAEVAVVKLLNI